MAVTKANVIACKRTKGGRAGCWIKKRGKTVFRFVNPDRLGSLGIPIVSAAAALKLLPGFAGRSRSRGSRRGTVTRLSGGFTFDGKKCRDSKGDFVPVPQCIGRSKAKKKTPVKRRKTTRKRTTRK